MDKDRCERERERERDRETDRQIDRDRQRRGGGVKILRDKN